MPIYEYKCANCGHTFEELQFMSEPPLTKCPNCGEEALQKLIGSGTGLIFKGSGFYLTDYKKKSSSHVDTAGKSESKPAASKTDTSNKNSSTSNKKD